ncbi:MAG: hypothetical protein M3Q07_16615, partial [Pseudobdellovibrionaceae bacterium]|nr:hypothetical protein [Pseudobdellovibrionaceae bacterium]
MRKISVVAVLATSLYACHQKSDLMNKKDRAANPAPSPNQQPPSPPSTGTPGQPGDTSYHPVA